MPRQLRVEFPGAIYHLMSRGDRREAIFLNDVDWHDLLKTLAEACQKTGWQVHAYCLMRNHFHLVAETPEPNLVEGMRWLLIMPLAQSSKGRERGQPLGRNASEKKRSTSDLKNQFFAAKLLPLGGLILFCFSSKGSPMSDKAGG